MDYEAHMIQIDVTLLSNDTELEVAQKIYVLSTLSVLTGNNVYQVRQ